MAKDHMGQTDGVEITLGQAQKTPGQLLHAVFIQSIVDASGLEREHFAQFNELPCAIIAGWEEFAKRIKYVPTNNTDAE